MKIVVRTLVLSLFAVGASAAVVNVHSASATTRMTVSSQLMSAGSAVPTCSPSDCPKPGTAAH